MFLKRNNNSNEEKNDQNVKKNLDEEYNEKEKIDLSREFEKNDEKLDQTNIADIAENLKLKNELEVLKKENTLLKDINLRKIAEFENFKKIVIKQKQEDRIRAEIDTILLFLPSFENLKRALNMSADLDENIASGLNMIKTQLEKTFSDLGIEIIDSLGKEFNPMFHEAVNKVEKEGEQPNTIVEVYSDGYLYKGKVIKPSIVSVAS